MAHEPCERTRKHMMHMGLNTLIPICRYRRAATSLAQFPFRVFRVFRGLFRGLVSQESVLGNGTLQRMDMKPPRSPRPQSCPIYSLRTRRPLRFLSGGEKNED
jgi:hypothetical protein